MTSRTGLLVFFGTIVAAALFAPAIADDANDELVQTVVTLLGDRDKDLRAVGLEQVRTGTKGAAATKRYVALLPKLSPEAQAGLLSALADRGDIAARPGVLELIAASKDEAVRVAAIRALGVFGNAEDIGGFVKLLGDGSATEKAAARASLVRLAGGSGRIAAALSETQPPVCVALIEILAARRALETVPAILASAVEKEASVRTAAMTALAQLATPEQLPGLVQGVLKAEAGKERDAAERSVATVCSQIADAKLRAEPLLAAINKLEPADRLALLPALGRVGGPAALAEVEGAIAAPDPVRHEVGIRAPANWPEAAIAPRMMELVKTEEHPKHRATVLAALIRIAPLPDPRSDGERLALLKEALAQCRSDVERQLVIKRARAIRIVESLRFLVPYLDDAAHAQLACESVVELAHHRGLREPNKPEFDKALDKVMATSKDPVVVDRAKRYKNGQTWVRPMAAAAAEAP